MNNYNSRIIIACDFNNRQELNEFLGKMGNKKMFLKLGMQLIYSEGFGIVDEMKKLGHNIFIDLKVHDIPNTASMAVNSLLQYSPDFITIHTLGGRKMMEAIIGKTKDTNVKVLGVTILTSHDQKSIDEMNIIKPVAEEVSDLMDLAIESGLTHIVCSAQEAALAKEKGLVSITPGIRLANKDNHDQSRVVTPEQAFKNGSSFIVMGRAITQASNPLEIYNKIEESI